MDKSIKRIEDSVNRNYYNYGSLPLRYLKTSVYVIRLVYLFDKSSVFIQRIYWTVAQKIVLNLIFRGALMFLLYAIVNRQEIEIQLTTAPLADAVLSFFSYLR